MDVDNGVWLGEDEKVVVALQWFGVVLEFGSFVLLLVGDGLREEGENKKQATCSSCGKAHKGRGESNTTQGHQTSKNKTAQTNKRTKGVK